MDFNQVAIVATELCAPCTHIVYRNDTILFHFFNMGDSISRGKKTNRRLLLLLEYLVCIHNFDWIGCSTKHCPFVVRTTCWTSAEHTHKTSARTIEADTRTLRSEYVVCIYCIILHKCIVTLSIHKPHTCIVITSPRIFFASDLSVCVFALLVCATCSCICSMRVRKRKHVISLQCKINKKK